MGQGHGRMCTLCGHVCSTDKLELKLSEKLSEKWEYMADRGVGHSAQTCRVACALMDILYQT